jgi:hypothetical protein
MVVLAIVLNVAFVAGGIVIVIVAMWRRTKMQEMQHRERMAMIERGLVPSPERDPAAFDAAMRRQSLGTSPFTTLGVAVIAIGLGVILIIAVAAGEPSIGIGVGGAIVLLGSAFVVNGALQRHRFIPPPPTSSMPRPPAPSAGPTDPPGPIAP